MKEADETHESDTHKSKDSAKHDTQPTKAEASVKAKANWRNREFWRVVLIGFGCLAVLIGAVVGYLFASSPVTVREPLLEHYHFRMQVVVNGKSENFGDARYQTGYSKDNCNVALPDSPIHFHDNKDQFVHIHWEGMTGGQVLKYYGWNFIGGVDNSLGYRFDRLPRLTRVPIHGSQLPAIPNDAKFYVYTGDENSYKEQNFDIFTKQDLEKFFNKTSNFPAHKLNQQKRPTSLLNKLKDSFGPTAYAHPGHDHGGEEELKRINNLLGNVVIFAQKDKPSDQQIKDRFNNLEPLTDSTCGG